MKIYLHGHEEWPVMSPDESCASFCGCDHYEVAEAMVLRWQRVMKEYRQVQHEMCARVRDREELDNSMPGEG